MLPIIISVLIISTVLNLVLFILLRKSRKAPQVTLSKDASQLLAEMLQGGAVVVTQVTDPASMFIYSPTDR